VVDLPTLSLDTFLVIENFFSLVFATFFGAALYFFFSRSDLLRKYRSAVTTSGVVLSIAAYHYFRIFESFKDAYVISGDIAEPSGVIFNEAYRYMDWIITVPLLVVELILVMGLAPERRSALLKKLVPASFAMIALGYPGELTTATGQQWLWWALAMVPFLYILKVLFSEVSDVISEQPQQVRGLFRLVRSTLVVTWLFYPVAYLFPIVLGNTGGALALENIGYAIADITAKAGYGLVIYLIARKKSELERAELSVEEAAAA
jgi:bacteriorhodopsin